MVSVRLVGMFACGGLRVLSLFRAHVVVLCVHTQERLQPDCSTARSDTKNTARTKQLGESTHTHTHTHTHRHAQAPTDAHDTHTQNLARPPETTHLISNMCVCVCVCVCHTGCGSAVQRSEPCTGWSAYSQPLRSVTYYPAAYHSWRVPCFNP